MRATFSLVCCFALVNLLIQQPACCLCAQKDTEKHGKNTEDERKRQQAIERHLKLVRDPKLVKSFKENGIILISIEELGDLKAEESIPDLVELLEIGGNSEPRQPFIDSAHYYPSVGALVNIGKPAVPAMIKALGEKERSLTYIHNAYRILGGILPGKSREVKELMEKEIQKEKVPARVKRITAVLEAMRGEGPKLGPRDTEELLRIMRDMDLRTSNPAMVIDAIEGLTPSKLEAAIPDFVELLEMGKDHAPSPLVDPSYWYPAVRALCIIGKPSVQPVVRALGEKDRSARYIHNAYSVLIGILPGQRKEAKEMVEKAIEKEKDADKIERLKAALEAMRAEDPKPVPKEKEPK